MKTALILSGGGAKGAFSVGALTYMTRERNDINFDIVSGTSTGALIAGLIIINRVDILRDIYATVNNDDIIRRLDPVKVFRNNQNYFYSDGPLTDIINQKITEAVASEIISSARLLLLTAVNLQTGKITVFANQDIDSTENYDVIRITNRDILIKAFRASSNQGAFLPPVNITAGDGKEYQFIDGGCREVIPCLAVMDQDPDKIYVLSNNPKYIFSVNAPYTGVLTILMRLISIFIQDVRENDIASLENWRENKDTVTEITYIEPDKDLDPEFPTGLRFERARMEVMMAQGEVKARSILEIPSSPRILARTVPGERETRSLLHVAITRCKARTQNGTRCKNKAVDETGYCRIHYDV